MKATILFILLGFGMASCVVYVTGCASKPIYKNCQPAGSYADAPLFNCEIFK
jgi:hypothetical protein